MKYDFLGLGVVVFGVVILIGVAVIATFTYMGTLGESYSIIMRLLPSSYRMFQPPAVLYDSMIFVTEANPTQIVNEK